MYDSSQPVNHQHELLQRSIASLSRSLSRRDGQGQTERCPPPSWPDGEIAILLFAGYSRDQANILAVCPDANEISFTSPFETESTFYIVLIPTGSLELEITVSVEGGPSAMPSPAPSTSPA